MKVIQKLLLVSLLFISATATAGNRIKYYFTKPVDNSVSKGVNAQYLNHCMGDTIVAYINRSKYTLDIAVYNYTSTFPGISVAVNAAYARGVRVRWIYDSSSSNTGIPLLNSGIKRLASPPDAGSYSIMHNKFMVIDANSSNPSDAIVWTGSSNWNSQQFNDDYNNAVVVQDQALAKAYRAHFNMMWGDTGIAPVPSLSKFGQFKTDLGQHHFWVDGTYIELFFSPSDNVNTQIQNAINSANTDMYVGMSTFTYSSNASMLVSKNGGGVYVASIVDASSSSSSVMSSLSSGLGSRYRAYTGSYLYHNKFMIVDASNSCSDPLVLTGSHNWTVSADTKNDENTLIIHDDTAANIYYQSFYANFAALGGSLTHINDCVTSAPTPSGALQAGVYPNPSSGSAMLNYSLLQPHDVVIDICDMTGRKVMPSVRLRDQAIGAHTYPINVGSPGVYIIRCATNEGVYTTRFVVTGS